MRLLLDTYIFIWAADENRHLGKRVKAELVSPDNEAFLSAASVWEIASKVAQGKMVFPVDELVQTAEGMELQALPITYAHALAASSLPRHHDDPFDCMLVAQAILEGLTLVTADRNLRHYGIPIMNAEV